MLLGVCQTWISIHKALAGLDLYDPETKQFYMPFQSTRPSRASTLVRFKVFR